MTQYFIHDGQNEKGPLNIEQLRLESLKKETPVWFEGLENWTTIGQVEELKSLFTSKLTPPPLKENIPFSSIAQNDLKVTSKRVLKVPLIILGTVVLIGMVGWLSYQNKSQADALNEVQQKVTQQDQQLTQQNQQLTQQQEEQKQKQAQDRQLQAEKDRINGQLAEKYTGYRNSWRNYIAVRNNQYSSSELGGISNLAVVVYNQTDKILDEVQIRVDYIKANGGSYKSETVLVTNISPTSSKSVYAPTSDRGTSVKMDIESITAKAFHFCYPNGNGLEGNKESDPYFCK